MIPLVLLVFAFVLFVVAGLTATPEPWRHRLVCYGLACWVASQLFSGASTFFHK